MSKPVVITPKLIYEILPDISTRETDIKCKKCGKELQIWGEVISIYWNDYFDGSGGMIDLCESCAKFIIGKLEEILLKD